MSIFARIRPYLVFALIWGLIWSAVGSTAWFLLGSVLPLADPLAEALWLAAVGYGIIGAAFGVSIAASIRQYGKENRTLPSIRQGGALGGSSALGAVYIFAKITGGILAGPQSILAYILFGLLGILLGGASGIATFAIVHRSDAKSLPPQPSDPAQIAP